MMSKVATVSGTERPDEFGRFGDAMFLASDQFSNIEQLFLILRGEIEVDDIDRKRVAALVQVGIDLAHGHSAVVGKAADAFSEACRA